MNTVMTRARMTSSFSSGYTREGLAVRNRLKGLTKTGREGATPLKRHVRRQLFLGGWFHEAMRSKVGGCPNRRFVRLTAPDLP